MKTFSAPRVSGQDRRLHDRFEASQLVSVRFAGRETVCRLHCLSSHGAQIALTNGLAPAERMRVEIVLADGSEVLGTVVWCRGERVGVAFASPIGDALDALNVEYRGIDYYRDLVALQRRAQRSER